MSNTCILLLAVLILIFSPNNAQFLEDYVISWKAEYQNVPAAASREVIASNGLLNTAVILNHASNGAFSGAFFRSLASMRKSCDFSDYLVLSSVKAQGVVDPLFENSNAAVRTFVYIFQSNSQQLHQSDTYGSVFAGITEREMALSANEIKMFNMNAMRTLAYYESRHLFADKSSVSFHINSDIFLVKLNLKIPSASDFLTLDANGEKLVLADSLAQINDTEMLIEKWRSFAFRAMLENFFQSFSIDIQNAIALYPFRDRDPQLRFSIGMIPGLDIDGQLFFTVAKLRRAMADAKLNISYIFDIDDLESEHPLPGCFYFLTLTSFKLYGELTGWPSNLVQLYAHCYIEYADFHGIGMDTEQIGDMKMATEIWKYAPIRGYWAVPESRMLEFMILTNQHDSACAYTLTVVSLVQDALNFVVGDVLYRIVDKVQFSSLMNYAVGVSSGYSELVMDVFLPAIERNVQQIHRIGGSEEVYKFLLYIYNSRGAKHIKYESVDSVEDSIFVLQRAVSISRAYASMHIKGSRFYGKFSEILQMMSRSIVNLGNLKVKFPDYLD